MGQAHHSIKFVSRRTGLSPHVIRVWERRYGAVKPNRSGTNRRLYSDEDIERLSLLRHAIQAGHSIGNIAALPEERLQLLADEGEDSAPATVRASSPHDFVTEALSGIREMDTSALQGALERGMLALGQHGLLEKVVAPLAQQLGALWREGDLTAAHEHFASAAIRTFLGQNSPAYSASANAPVVLVATPAGQLHEIGAVMVAAAAADLGWRPIYLGPSLPSGEIASAAIRSKARAVALSIVYPEDDPNLPGELESLRKYLPPGIHILAGGRAAEAYEPTLHRIGASRLTGFKGLYAKLDEWRREQK